MNVNTELLLWLLIFYQIKHYLADFVFQNVWMLQKSRPGWDFIWPLTIHSGIHALFTIVLALYLYPQAWWLGILDFVLHFLMDRIKAGPRYMGRWSDMRSKAFWVCFGFDQMVHQLVHLYICWFLAATIH